jgi:hypothetical protein
MVIGDGGKPHLQVGRRKISSLVSLGVGREVRYPLRPREWVSGDPIPATLLLSQARVSPISKSSPLKVVIQLASSNSNHIIYGFLIGLI